MVTTDTNPPFWQEWKQLGHAVVIRAVYDYIGVRKKQAKLDILRDAQYRYSDELSHFERFFKSRYFGLICPDYDGWEMYNLLEYNWKNLYRMHRGHKAPVLTAQYYQNGEPPKKQGQYKRKNSEWGKN